MTASAAAPKLGFGAPPTDPGLPPQDDTEPAAFEDNAGNVWLFWRSRRDGAWKIWYNQFNGTNWGATQRLTAGTLPEFAPAVVFEPVKAGNRDMGLLEPAEEQRVMEHLLPHVDQPEFPDRLDRVGADTCPVQLRSSRTGCRASRCE